MGSGGLQWDADDLLSNARLNQKTIYVAASSSPPASTYAGQLWFESDLNILLERNGTNSAWVQVNPNVAIVAQTEIDFGATPISEASFTITDANVTASSKIVAMVAYVAPTGKDLDEIECDELDIKCGNGSGTFPMYVKGMEGYVHDKFKINYIIGF